MNKQLTPPIRAYLKAADGHMLFKDAVLELVTSFEMTPEQAAQSILAYAHEITERNPHVPL